MAAYKLVVFSNPVAGREDEFNRWYTETHLADVLRMPGVTSAQRLVVNGPANSKAPTYRYMATYDIETNDPDGVLKELRSRAGTDAMQMSDAMDRTMDVKLYRVIAERSAQSAETKAAAQA